jgi:FAD:protein FMN transferase
MCQDYCVARLRPGMGTLTAIESWAESRRQAQRALEAGFAALSRAEDLLHPTRAGGDLAALNEAPAGQTVLVRAWTAALLRLGRELCLLSCGQFDPALPGCGSILHWAAGGARRVHVRRPARLDLSGIAKGFAVDRAVDAMRRAGATRGLVNAGGDLRVFGRHNWPLVVRLGGGRSLHLKIRNAALCGSDPHQAAAPSEHRGYFRRAGRCGTALPRATAVLAPQAAIADALTKVLMFAPPGQSARLLARYRAQEITPGAQALLEPVVPRGQRRVALPIHRAHPGRT